MAPLHLENFIGGAYVQARTDRCTELVDPSTGEVFGDAPTSGQADVDLAYESAAKAFESWRSTTPAQRQEALLRGRRTGARGREWFHVRAGDRSRPVLARSSM
jgi:betaine-aldehyde dehydrogenase